MRLLLSCLVLALAAASCRALLPEELSTKPQSRKVPARHLPFAGNGTCGKAVYDAHSDTTTVQCLGPKHLLSPGQTIDTNMLLESPYPSDRLVVAVNISSQMVDDNLRAVPLSELYVHHFGTGFNFIAGSGAELRGSFQRKPLPAPYAQVVNGSFLQSPMNRVANIQLINTVGLPKAERKACLECWCDHDPWHPVGVTSSPASALTSTGPSHDKGDPTANNTRPGMLAGSLLCCHQCPTDQPLAGPIGYHLQYTVTYREIKKDEKVTPVNLLGFDVAGGEIEYQLTEATGPGTTHTQVFDTTVDAACPQSGPFAIVRCVGHQHFGAQCLSLTDLDNNRTICRTCPTFGKREGVPGDELGYVVAIPDDDLVVEERPYNVKPGMRVRVESKYDASVPRFGIMGLMLTYTAGMPEPCNSFAGAGKNKSSNEVYLSSPDSSFRAPLYSLQGLPMQMPAYPQAETALDRDRAIVIA